jgi:hypothetical protein
MPSLKRIMEKELKLIRTKSAVEEDNGWRIIERDGTRRKARPEEVPNPFISGDGVSAEDGIPVTPKIDSEMKKHVKKRRS